MASNKDEAAAAAPAATSPAADVTVSVEFAGICLYVIDRRQTETTVGVLIPTCVPNDRVRTTHEDEDQGARHVPYLLLDLANLDLPDDQKVKAGLVADGPRFQVVRRLNREDVFFQPAQPPGSITLNPDPLPLPDLSLYKDRIRLKDQDRLFSDIKGPDERPELNVRTTLKGGTLTATTFDGSGKTGGRPSKNPNWDRDPEAWAGSIEWTGRVPGALTIGIHNWDTGENTELTLRPVRGQNVIRLKIANLCETNPLEWRQFEHRLQKDDVDFKWLFRLFDPTDPTKRLIDAFGGRGHKFPYPKLTDRPARTTGSQGCTGGQFGLP